MQMSIMIVSIVSLNSSWLSESHQCSLSSLGAGGSLFSLDAKMIKTVGSDSSDAISKHFNGIKSQSSAKHNKKRIF